jgi:hypothetical protein
MNHTPLVLYVASALALVVANIALWRPIPQPTERILYVTNTVTTIREVPAPSQPAWPFRDEMPIFPSKTNWIYGLTNDWPTNWIHQGPYTNGTTLTNLNVLTNYIAGHSLVMTNGVRWSDTHPLTVLVSTNFDAGWVHIPTNWLTPEGLKMLGGAR